MKRRRMDDRTADALLSGRPVAGEPELTAFVAETVALTPDAPPAPSAALAAMLEAGLPSYALVRENPPAAARRAVSWRYALAGVGAFAFVLGAGAANALPGPAQNAVADVVGWVTPLHLPRPDSDHPAPAVVPTDTPSPTAAPSEHATTSPGPTRSPEPRESSGHGGPDATESPGGSDGGSTSGSDGGSGESPKPSATATSDSGGSGGGGGSSDGGSQSPTPTPSSTPDSGSGAQSSSDGSGSLGTLDG